MAGPITWRNVAPSADPNVAMQLLLSSERSIGNALGSFQKIVQDRNAFGAQEAATVREGNKQAFLDALAGAKTPEELAALQASGNLNTLKARLTPEGLAAVRGADEARLTGLRQQMVAGQQFDDGQIARRERPILDRVASRIASGDTAGARGILEAENLSQEAPLYSALSAAEQAAVVRERANRDDTWKVEDRKTKTALDALTLKRAQGESADAEEGRRFETRLAQESLRANAERDALGLRLGELAQVDGLPLTANKHPDFANWNPEQIQQFDELAKQAGLPGSRAYTNGDTARADNLFKTLAGSGEFSPRLLRANEAAIRNVYSSSQGSLVGNDRVNQVLADAANQVGFDRVDASNWYAPNTSDARKSYEDLASKVPEIVKGSSNGLSAAEDVEDVQRLVGEIASVGIKRKDGTFVTPSANDVMRFIRQSEGGWFRDATRANNIRKELEAWVNTKEAMQMAKDGLESQAYRDKQRMLQIARETLNPVKK